MLHLGIPALAASSYDPAVPMEKYKETSVQQAVVTKIESDTVTLQSLTDDKKIIIISRKDAGLLRTGDTVLLDGDTVTKIGSMPESAPIPAPSGEAAPSGKQPNQPPALPQGPTGTSGTE
jgi:hypothetical protein